MQDKLIPATAVSQSTDIVAQLRKLGKTGKGAPSVGRYGEDPEHV
jgi:hypothetical protein